MTDINIHQALTQFFKDQFDVELPSASTDLIEAGILDSLMLIEVVTFIESEFSVTTEFDDLEIENFISIESMTRFVTARLPPPSTGVAAVAAGQSESAVAVGGS